MKKVKIGIFGSIGYDDIGDDALLLTNIEYFREKGYQLTIFTSNIARTRDFLTKEMFLSSDDISNKISIVESLDIFFSRSVTILKYLDSLIDTISDKLFKSRLGLFNSSLYFHSLKNKLLNICKENNNRKDIESIKLKEFIYNLKSCSLIFFIGGGYFNKHWGSKINQFLVTIDIAKRYKKPIIASGQTFGPLNIVQKGLFKKRVNYFDLFSVRDVNKSKSRLLEVGFKNEIFEGPDDAIFLRKKSLEWRGISNSTFNIVINFGGFLRYSKKPLYKLYKEIAQFLDQLVTTKNARIIYISMDKGGADYLRGIEIQSKMENQKRMYFVPLNTGPREIKWIISKSNLVLSNRLHPVVFAIAEKIPFIGIVAGGDYYSSKLGGITEIYSYDSKNHLIDINKLNTKILNEYLVKSLHAKYDNTLIYKRNRTKRMDFLKKTEKILNSNVQTL